ncbi:MAG: hypothetical protein SGI99_09225 [Pseudomonadota bacterium]|nr:hypothetical protein [Pseudomonadota bacterium]
MKSFSQLLATILAFCLFAFALHSPADAQGESVQPTPANPATPTPRPINPLQPAPLNPEKPARPDPAAPKPINPVDSENVDLGKPRLPVPVVPSLDPTDLDPNEFDPTDGTAHGGSIDAPEPMPQTSKECITFSCVDINRDSRVSLEELAQSGAKSLSIKTLDNDGNGTVDEIEWKNFARDIPQMNGESLNSAR